MRTAESSPAPGPDARTVAAVSRASCLPGARRNDRVDPLVGEHDDPPFERRTAIRIPVRSRVVKTECTRKASRARCCSRRSSRAGPHSQRRNGGDDTRRQRAGEQPAGIHRATSRPGGRSTAGASGRAAAATAAATNPDERRALPVGDLIVVRARQRERHDLAAGMAFGLRHGVADGGGLLGGDAGRQLGRARMVTERDSSAAGAPRMPQLTAVGAPP